MHVFLSSQTLEGFASMAYFEVLYCYGALGALILYIRWGFEGLASVTDTSKIEKGKKSLGLSKASSGRQFQG